MNLGTAKYILLIFTGLVMTSKTLLGQSDRHLKQAISSSLAAEKLTGAVWSVVEGDGSILTDCSGIKNNDSKEELKPTDRVHVGSVAKTVVAAGILHLATSGKLNIDDPVKKYLPAVSFINAWESTNPITLRHLLDHTSGLSDVRLWHLFNTTSSPDAPLSDFFANDPSVLRIYARPGSIYSYSNMGYTLLGMVIESVTKQRYEAYLDESFLKPLGMRRSTFEFVTQTGDSGDKDLAMGHLDKRETSHAVPVYVRPAGQFTTTAGDMGLFMKFMMSDGRISGRVFIRKAFLGQLGKAHQTDASKNGLPKGYGLGASYRDRHGVRGIVHPGVILGFHAMIYMFPEEQKAFFISHNMESETADYEVFNEILIKHLHISRLVAEPSSHTTKQLAAWNGYYVPAINKVVPFAFLDYIFGHTKVKVNARGAVLEVFQDVPVELAYAGDRLFILKGRTGPSHTFYKNDENQHFISTGLRTLKKVRGLYILLASISFIAGAMGLLYLLVSGIRQLFRFKRTVWRQPLIWCFSAICLVLLSILCLIFQPFITLGDLTIGSFLLAVGTAMLPVFTVVSIYWYWRRGLARAGAKGDFIALIFLFQLLIVLFLNDLVPLVLWE